MFHSKSSIWSLNYCIYFSCCLITITYLCGFITISCLWGFVALFLVCLFVCLFVCVCVCLFVLLLGGGGIFVFFSIFLCFVLSLFYLFSCEVCSNCVWILWWLVQEVNHLGCSCPFFNRPEQQLRTTDCFDSVVTGPRGRPSRVFLSVFQPTGTTAADSRLFWLIGKRAGFLFAACVCVFVSGLFCFV